MNLCLISTREELELSVYCVAPPIPWRNFDWCAIDSNTYDGQGSPIGFGRTPIDAINELFDEIEEKEAQNAEKRERGHPITARSRSRIDFT